MIKTRGVIITVKTKDFKHFKEYYKDLYQKSFAVLEDDEELFVIPYKGKVHDNGSEDISMLKIETEAWDILKSQYHIIDEFVKSLDYYEMIIITDDRTADYIADKGTFQQYGKRGCNIHYEYHITVLTNMEEQY